MQKTSAGAVLDRIRQVISASDDSEAARILGVKRSTLGSWRDRDSVPYAQCVNLAEQKGISLDWLLTGNGAMHRASYGEAPPPSALEVRESPPDPLRQRRAQVKAIVDQLDASGLEAVQEELEKIERMKTLEQRVAELEKKAG